MNKKIIIIAVIVAAVAVIGHMIAQEFKSPGFVSPEGSTEFKTGLSGEPVPTAPHMDEMDRTAPEDETDIITRQLASQSHSAFLSKEYRVKCSPCHNKDGMGPLGVTIRGQSKEEILQKLQAYKSGEKENTLMQNLVNNLSDEEMEQLAEEISNF